MVEVSTASTRRSSGRGSFGLLLLAMLVALVMMVGCPRPSVDVAPEKGAAGEACAAEADCETGLECVAQSCCPDATCASRCSSLFEKEGTVANEAAARYPDNAPFLRNKCIRFCCGGAEGSELEARLEIWARPFMSP